MDRATRDQRRRNKEQNGKRGQLPEYDKTGLGRKGKSATQFPTRRCEHVEGGKKILIFRVREDKSRYAVPLIKGGTRCPNSELAKGRCLDHIAETD